MSLRCCPSFVYVVRGDHLGCNMKLLGFHVREESSTTLIDIVARACTESHYFRIVTRSLAPETTDFWIGVHLEAAIACTRIRAIHVRWLDTRFPRCQ